MSVWQEEVVGSSGTPIWLVSASGRLDHNLTPQLENTLNALLNREYDQFVVNLSEVTYINSGGLRCLVAAWRQARQRGGNLVLFGLNKRLSEVFTMVGFHKVFQIYDTAEEALQNVKPEA